MYTEPCKTGHRKVEQKYITSLHKYDTTASVVIARFHIYSRTEHCFSVHAARTSSPQAPGLRIFIFDGYSGMINEQ